MRKVSLSVLLLLVFAFSFARATEFQVPDRKITGAEFPIALGEMVDLSVSEYAKPAHLAGISYDWKVFDQGKEKKVRKADGGVFFGAGIKSKKMIAFCVITYLFAVKDDKGVIIEIGTKTQFLSAVITIGDEKVPDPDPIPPEPGPGPGPEPVPPKPEPDTPEPDFVEGKYGLSRYVYRAAMVRVLSGNERFRGAMSLRNSFEGIRAAINAGTIKTAEEVLRKTKEANNSSLKGDGVSIDAWEDFSTNLQERLYALSKDKKMVSLDDYKIAWSEIATGLALIPRPRKVETSGIRVDTTPKVTEIREKAK